MMVLWSALAGAWSGVAPDAVAGVEHPVYLAPDAGWSAALAGGGTVRVRVAEDAAGAAEWLHARVAERPSAPPAFPFAQEAFGNGLGYLLFRDENVAVVVERPGSDALEVAARLVGALQPDTPWPSDPTLAFDGRVATVTGDWAWVSIRAGGVVDAATLLPAPVTVVPDGPGRAVVMGSVSRVSATAWDRYGRTGEAVWTAP